MLKEVYIDGYKNFSNFKADLADIRLICGLNGTGKSSFLKILYRVIMFVTNNSCHVGGLASFWDTPRWGAEKERYTSAGFTYLVDDNEYRYELVIRHIYDVVPTGTSVVYTENLICNDKVIYMSDLKKNESCTILDDGREFKAPLNPSFSGLMLASHYSSVITNFILPLMENFYALALNTGVPTNLQRTPQAPDRLSPLGNNFREWYLHTVVQKPIQSAEAINLFKEFISNLLNFYVNKKNNVLTVVKRLSNNSTFELAFEELSDGQQKLIIYYYLLKVAPDGATIIIDEFESHLSVAELRPLYHQIQWEMDRRDLQVIIISHNERTLNWYHDVALRFYLDENGVVNAEKFDADEKRLTLTELLEGQGA